MNQRPDFADAKREFKRLHDEHVKETSEGNTPIHPQQRTRQRRNQQFEGLEEYDYQVDLRTGKPEASSIFIFVNFSMGPARRLEVKRMLEFLANLILD